MASPRYRVHQFLPYLRACGWTCDVLSPLTNAEYAKWSGPGGAHIRFHTVELRRRIGQILRARRYDVLVVQKALTTIYWRGFERLLDRVRAPIVFDIDDAVHLQSPVPFPGRAAWLESRDQIRHVANRAELVLAGNAWLRDELSEASRRIEVFPTVVDTDRFVPGVSAPPRFIIGWMGNPSTAKYLAPLRGVLGDVQDAEVVCVGAGADVAGMLNARCEAWQEETEVEQLQSFSVGLMPMPDEPWSRGKCGLKALQYLACGVPCVASPVGVAPEIVEHGVTGYLAGSESEWAEALERLRDTDTQREMGLRARERVERDYSLNAAAPRLKTLLESVV